MEWDDLGDYLGVPTSILSEIQKKYSDDTQRKQAMLEEWRNHHPAPSWMLVADALYSGLIGESGKYHKLLLVVKEKYLKGKIILHMSHCVVGVHHTCTEHPLKVEDGITPTLYPSSGVHFKHTHTHTPTNYVPELNRTKFYLQAEWVYIKADDSL